MPFGLRASILPARGHWLRDFCLGLCRFGARRSQKCRRHSQQRQHLSSIHKVTSTPICQLAYLLRRLLTDAVSFIFLLVRKLQCGRNPFGAASFTYQRAINWCDRPHFKATLDSGGRAAEEWLSVTIERLTIRSR